MPQDRQTYSELDKSRWSYSPNLIRWRHRYRGVRESEKFNQAHNQTLFDLYSINARQNKFFDTLNEHMTEMYVGKSNYEDVDYYHGSTDALGNYETAGLKDLNERITAVDRVLRRLENDG